MYYTPDRTDVLEVDDFLALRDLQLLHVGTEQRVVLTFALTPTKHYAPGEAPDLVFLTNGVNQYPFRVTYVPLESLGVTPTPEPTPEPTQEPEPTQQPVTPVIAPPVVAAPMPPSPPPPVSLALGDAAKAASGGQPPTNQSKA